MLQLNARFSCKDGEYRWLCPRCGSVLGIVARGCRNPTAEEMQQQRAAQKYDEKLASFIESFQGNMDEYEKFLEVENEKIWRKIPTSIVELREGYVLNEQKEMWLKPENPRGSRQGAHNRDYRQFARARSNNAHTKGDVVTVLDEQMKIERATEKKLTTEKPVLFAADFPAGVLCHKAGCKTVSIIPSVKGVLL